MSYWPDGVVITAGLIFMLLWGAWIGTRRG